MTGNTNDQANSGIYTYRNGKKVFLKKDSNKLIIREKPEELAKKGITKQVEKVSSASTMVTVPEETLDPLMNELRKESVTHHSYKQENNNAEFLITDRILVSFKKPVSNEDLSAFMARYALILKNKYSEKEFLFQLTNQTGMNPVKLVVLISETEKDVESCEHDLNKRMKVSDVNVPADNKYLQQWHLHTSFNNPSFDTRSSANCQQAWNLLNHFGNSEVVVAVSDDGCKLDHADFNSMGKFGHWAYFQGTNLINRDSVSADPKKMYQTGADHGTCCCGVIGAEIDGALTVGAAPGCKLLPIKWESDESSLFISDSKMMNLLSFISDKADILSNSWGSTPESVWSTQVVTRITNLAKNGGRRGKGLVFSWASGNENSPISYTGNLDIPCDNGFNESGNWVGAATSRVFENNLVGVAGVMHIAALSSYAQRSHYSNYGDGISVCAPSSNSHEYWRMAVTGLDIMTTSGRAPFYDAEFGGTSSATPLVAGICALIISANPQLSAYEIISILQRTASRNLNMNGYAKTPPAAYDPDTSWDISPVPPHDTGTFKNTGHPDGTWSSWFGFGKADAAAAVAEALRLAGTLVVSENSIDQAALPALSIPDNNSIGISSQMNVNAQGNINTISVDVDITHNYIGDLQVSLVAPSGRTVVLHNRNGSSTKNINKTYNFQNTPTLASLINESFNGNWTLVVKDLAQADIGILNKWGIHLRTSAVATEEVDLVDMAGVIIPDNNPAGIERSMNTTSSGTIRELEIGIDISHTYISDLIVNLISPQGFIINLHKNSGGAEDNIIRTYNYNNKVDLRNLTGQQIQGNWKLKISDVAGQDIGKLNKWSLKILKE